MARCEARVRSLMTLGPGFAYCQNQAAFKVLGKTKEEQEQPPMLLCCECRSVFEKRNPDYTIESLAV